MGCAKVSEGCKHCYMFRDQARYGHDPNLLRRSQTTFEDPLKWREPRRIFVCSWSDFFLETVPMMWRHLAWEIIRKCPQHTFLLLTKRPQNIGGMLPDSDHGGPWPWPQVWIGVSAENQRRADERIPILLQVPAAVHFVSAEPLLGPIDLGRVSDAIGGRSVVGGIDWVITGGESDPAEPRPMSLDWARSIRDQCQDAGVAFFHKQHGGRRKIDGAWGGRNLDGRTWDEMPLPDALVDRYGPFDD
jgi:protein gp37